MTERRIPTAAEDAADDFLELQDRTPERPLPGAFQGTDAGALLSQSARTGRSLLAAGAVVPIAADTLAAGARNDFRRLTGSDEPLEQPGTSAQDWYFRNVVEGLGTSAVDHWTPNATDVGGAATVVNTLFQVAGAVPQIVGMPGVFAASTGADPTIDLLDQGVDLKTAATVGVANATVNAIGLRIPAAFGTSIPTRIGTGAGANLVLGAGVDVVSSSKLTTEGYAEQAAQYDPANPTARFMDVAMGAVFGAASAVRASPTQRAAVLTAHNADHYQRQTLPGEPLTRDAAVQHQDELATAIQNVLDGKPVNATLDLSQFKLRPELELPLRPAVASAGFESAVTDVLRAEGGFVNDPVDRGGATNFGISSRANPDIDVANLTEEGAKAIYRERYWDPINADALPPDLQGPAFDAAVNQGVGWTKRALREAGNDPERFLELREQHYRGIVAADPSQAKFLRGWLNRIGKFRETTDAGRALRARLIREPEQLARDYASLEDSRGGTVLNTDVARELAPEYLADRTRSADVHEAASDTIKTLYTTKLSEPTPEGFEPVVLFTAGGTGAGKTSAIDQAGDAFGKPEIVYDTNMNTLRSAAEKVEQALAAGRKVEIVYIYRDPVEALTGGAIPRAQRQAAKFGSGRTVPLDEHAKTHIGVRPVMEELAAQYQGDPRVTVTAIDNSRGRGNSQIVPLESLPRVEDNLLRERLQEALNQAHASGLDDSLYRGFAAAGRAGSGSAGRPPRAGDGRQPQPENGAEVSRSAADAADSDVELRAVREAIAAIPDLQVIDENGVARPAAEFLAQGEVDAAQTAETLRAIEAAASCYLRTAA